MRLRFGNASVSVKAILVGLTPRVALEARLNAVNIEERKRQQFESVMLPHLDAAYNLARWLTGNERDATRAVDQSYQQALREFDYCHGQELKTWLLSIVHNSAQNCIHSHEPVKSAGSPPGEVQMSERNRLRAVIEQLPSDCREVFVLREVEHMSYRQIAAVCGLTTEGVISRLSIARDCLVQHQPGRNRKSLQYFAK